MAKYAAPIREQVWSLQLRIELLGVAPTIWRRVIVPETIKLPTLHRVFQTVLGWTNRHLHVSVICGVAKSTTSATTGTTSWWSRIGSHIPTSRPAWFIGATARTAARPRMWAVSTATPSFSRLADPDHEERDSYLTWVGGHFDPKRFDLDATNLALSKVRA
jgi:Plasmid pRiA4b ORF-3-like protein